MANFREFISRDRTFWAYVNADAVTCILPTKNGCEIHFIGGTSITLPIPHDQAVLDLRNPHLTIPSPSNVGNCTVQ